MTSSLDSSKLPSQEHLIASEASRLQEDAPLETRQQIHDAVAKAAGTDFYSGPIHGRPDAEMAAPTDSLVNVLRRAHTTFDQVETDAHAQDVLFEWWGEIQDRLAEMKAALEKLPGSGASAQVQGDGK